MKKLDRAIQLCEIIGIGFGAYAVRVFLSGVSQSTISPAFATLISVAVVIVCAKSAKYVIAELLDRSTVLRRVVAGQSFIEGDWLDYADGHFGLLTIRYDDGAVRVHGNAISKDGTILYTWRSVIADFDGIVLEYLFRADVAIDGDPFNEDYGHIRITFLRPAPRSAPCQFSGAFCRFGKDHRLIQVHGIRLSRTEAQEIRDDYAKIADFAHRLPIRDLTARPDENDIIDIAGNDAMNTGPPTTRVPG
ncbi:MAG: hypothetical protein AAF745_07855 [Planctomycetota bacterium]